MEERKIQVKDKTGKLIDVFSNLTPAGSPESQKDLMVAPTIDIVSNGESTLSFQMLADSAKWQRIKNPENLYYCNGRVYTALNEESIVYSGEVVTVNLVELWYLLGRQYVQAHNVDTKVETLDEHTVKILPKTDSKFKLTVNGVQYEDSDVRDSRGVIQPRGSAGYALWAILRGSGWSLGVCDVLPDGFSAKDDYGTFNVESDMKDILYNIQLIQQLYGGILDWDSMNKTVSLRDESKQGGGLTEEEFWQNESNVLKYGELKTSEKKPLVEISDAIKNSPIEVVAEFEPIQEGSGDPSPDNVRPIVGRQSVELTHCGKNLINIPTTVSNIVDFYYMSYPFYGFSTGAPVKNDFTLSFSFKTNSDFSGKQCTIVCYKTDETTFENSSNGASVSLKIPAGTNIKFIEVRWNRYGKPFTDTTSVYTDFQLEIGEKSTEYEVYSAHKFEIDFNENVYGGNFNWNSGILKTNWAKTTLSKVINSKYTSEPSSGISKFMGYLKNGTFGENNIFSDKLNQTVAAHSSAKPWQISTHYVLPEYVYITVPEQIAKTVEELKEWLYQNGDIEIVYKLNNSHIQTFNSQQFKSFNPLDIFYSSFGTTCANYYTYPKESPFKRQYGFNEWKGYSVRKGKNLSESPKIVWDNKLITRLYPLGNGNLNIKKVNNGNGYVDNFSYTNAVYEGYLRNPNIYDTHDEGGQKTLKAWAERKVAELCKPRKSIFYNIVDARATNEQRHEKFDVNDIVKAYYTNSESEKETFEMLRIQHLQYNWFNPSSDSVVEVGDKTSNVNELFHQIYKNDKYKTPTDANGHISGSDIYIEIPEYYWDALTGGSFGYGSLKEITELHAYNEKKNEEKITQAESAVSVLADEFQSQVDSFTSFVEQTENTFSQSFTQINQVSTALDAQIRLEASHYEETKKSITSAETSIRQYADSKFATISSLTKYATVDLVNDAVSSSESTIKQWAGKNFAGISISARVNEMYSGISVSSSNVLIAANVHQGGAGAYLNITSGDVDIRGGRISIYGREVHFDSKGFLKG